MAMTQDRLKQLNECLPDKIEAIGRVSASPH